jgi:hypothetical protein
MCGEAVGSKAFMRSARTRGISGWTASPIGVLETAEKPINSDQAPAERASPGVERTGGTGLVVSHVRALSDAFYGESSPRSGVPMVGVDPW